MAVESAVGTAARRPQDQPSFRPDVDGLRAVAILAVVAFHAGVPGFDGGFVGVDVFFVISGYLITGNLARELRTDDRVSLAAFWARRIRRLVPALGLMVVTTFALARFVLSPVEWGRVAREGILAALYLSNIEFARDAADYFADHLNQSLYLHTWSLSVEEQFYLLWPLLAGLVAVATRRRARATPTLLRGAFVVLLVTSFAFNLWLTGRGSAWAFFGLPTRAWEFAAAGLLVLAPPLFAQSRRWVPIAVAALGLVLIAWSVVALSDADPYPGWRATLPVLGTLLLLAAGDRTANPLSQGLGARPLQRLGRVSYSWYLWHWPLMLLAIVALDDDSLAVRAGAVLVALPIAVCAYLLVENPLRFSSRLRASKPRTYVMGLAVTAVVFGAGLALTRDANQTLTESPYREIAQTRADYLSYRDEVCRHPATSASGIEHCVQGAPDGPTTVMLVGDSHARQWKDAFSAAAEDLDAQLVVRWSSGCPVLDLEVADDPTLVNESCPGFRESTAQLIDDLEPDAVVVAHNAGYELVIDGDVVSGDTAADRWADAYRSYLDDLQERGIRVGALLDNPKVPYDPLTCIARAEGDVTDCELSREEALERVAPHHRAESAVLADLGAVPTFGVTDDLCGPDWCTLRQGEVYTFVDGHHLTTAYVASQIPEVTEFLAQVLGLGAN